MRGRWTVPIILVLAAGLRLGYLAAARDDPRLNLLVHDAARYHAWASALAEGSAFEAGPYYQAPLYPLLLSGLYRITGPVPEAAYVIQLLLGVATIAWVARIARRAYGERAKHAAAMLYALYGPAVFHETTLMPTALACFLVAVALERLQAAERSGRGLPYVLAGMMAGLAASASSATLIFGLLSAIWILRSSPGTRQARLTRAALVLGGLALVVLPFAVRNRVIGGEWTLLATNGGITFAHGNHPDSKGLFTLLPGFTGSVETQREETRSLAERAEGRRLTDGEVSAYWFRRGLDFPRSDPLGWIVLECRKMALALSSREQPLESDPAMDTNPVRNLLPVPFAVLLGLAFARWAGQLHRCREETPILLSLLSALLVLVAFYVSSRYRMTAIPALTAMAGAGAARLVASTGAIRWRMVWITSSIAAISWLWVPVFGSDLERSLRGQGSAERGRLLIRAGRVHEGTEALRRGVQLDPDNAYGWIDLGEALAAAGAHAEAERAVREASRLAPALPYPHFRLGVLLFQAGRLAEAAEAFERAYRLDPLDRAVANNLLGTLMRLGRFRDAREIRTEMEVNGVPVDDALKN